MPIPLREIGTSQKLQQFLDVICIFSENAACSDALHQFAQIRAQPCEQRICLG